MAFADLDPNQMVDEANAVTGGFPAIGTKLSPTNKCYAKAEALAAYNLNSALMVDYANNQLVPKKVWQSAAAVYTTWYLSPSGNASATTICSSIEAAVPRYSTIMTDVGIPPVGTIIYTNNTLTTPFNGGSLYWKCQSNDNSPIATALQISASGQVLQKVSCQVIPPNIPCDEQQSSGHQGVTEFSLNLSSSGGLITIALECYTVPDKLELIHNGVKKATSGMTVANAGPFDNVYGSPTVPTGPQVDATDQFIGSRKGSIPTRQSTFTSETGSSIVIPSGYQQLIWWQYTPANYTTNPILIIRLTGPDGTDWKFKRIC